MIQVESFSQINGISFGSSEQAFVAAFGEPASRRVNRKSAQELHYPDCIARFDAKTGQLYEFTLLPGCVASLNGMHVEWKPAFLSAIQQVDPGLMESYGFIVSYKLGLAFTGFHDDDRSQMAIHAFQRGLWDADKKDMKPFPA